MGTSARIGDWRAEPAIDAPVELRASRPDPGTPRYEDEEPAVPARWLARVGAILLVLAAAGWIGLFGWRAALAVADGMPSFSAILTGLAILSAPLALIGVAYLLLLRTSRREARRFGATAEAMRAEAAALEEVLARVSARIEEHRRALGDHAHQLLLLGDEAAARLGEIGGTMRGESDVLARHTGMLEHAARGACADMAVLLEDLPRAARQSSDLAAILNEAGIGAHAQAGALETALAALGRRGREAEEVAGGAAQRLTAQVAQIEGASVLAGERMAATAGEMTAGVDAALAHAARSLDEARRAIEAQSAAMLAMVEQGRTALGRTGDESTRVLSERLDRLGARLDGMSEQLVQQDAAGAALVERLDGGLVGLARRFEELGRTGTAQTEQLGEAIGVLGARAALIDGALDRGGQAAESLIARTESLVGLLRRNGAMLGEALPDALAELERRIEESGAALGALVPQAAQLAASAGDAHATLGSADALLLRQATAIRALGLAAEERLATIQDHADRVSATLADSGEQARRLVDSSAPQLVDALLRVRETAAQAADHAREALAAVIPEAARALGDAAHGALERAIDAKIEAQMAEVTSAGTQAVEATHRATERLTRQMLSLTATTATIETRIAQGRAENEKVDEDSLSRRVALLIDALNSTAIDVAGILSQDVSDSAWTAYLKGDRGIFTRRSVRLIDSAQVREIQRLYGRNPSFHEQLNRYIADFEAMLRRVLASRDGSSLAITLLSSDVGKLYVALAQAIERLRN